jgi:hypothetical protein
MVQLAFALGGNPTVVTSRYQGRRCFRPLTLAMLPP